MEATDFVQTEIENEPAIAIALEKILEYEYFSRSDHVFQHFACTSSVRM